VLQPRGPRTVARSRLSLREPAPAGEARRCTSPAERGKTPVFEICDQRTCSPPTTVTMRHSGLITALTLLSGACGVKRLTSSPEHNTTTEHDSGGSAGTRDGGASGMAAGRGGGAPTDGGVGELAPPVLGRPTVSRREPDASRAAMRERDRSNSGGTRTSEKSGSWSTVPESRRPAKVRESTLASSELRRQHNVSSGTIASKIARCRQSLGVRGGHDSQDTTRPRRPAFSPGQVQSTDTYQLIGHAGLRHRS
jgi:hypothetical protein